MELEYTELTEAAIDEITVPSRSDKLHPYENENVGDGQDLSELQDAAADGDELTDWEEFRLSVGTQPRDPVEVMENGDGYELIDGDRRLRALRENGAQTTFAVVKDPGEEVTQEEKDVLMLESNEHRRPNDAEQRARKTANLCAPWLLPPGERSSAESITQSQLAKQVGRTQPAISGWLETVHDEYPLRSAVGEIAKQPGRQIQEDRIEQIDRVVDLLTTGGEDGSRIVAMGRELFVAEELGNMDGVSLSELESAAERAAENGWDDQRFLQYVDEEFADDEEIELGIQSGMADGDDEPWEDTTELDTETDTDPEPQQDDGPDLETPDIEVEWENVLDGADIESSLGELQQKTMIVESFEDDAAIALQILQEQCGLTQEEVVDQIVEPLLVDRTVQALQE